MSQNCQTHFKNLAACAVRFFKCVSKYLFANKKNYDWVTVIKINWKVATSASQGLVNTEKVNSVEEKKNHFCCWQGNTIHAYKACIYIVVPQ